MPRLRGAAPAALLLLVSAATSLAPTGAATDPALVAKLQAMQATFERMKKERMQALEKMKATNQEQEAILQERIDTLQNAQHRRLDNSSSQNISYNTGNITSNADDIADLQSAADHIWLLLCGALVMFMQAGFAMVESGVCRQRNVQNILMKNLVDVCLGTLCWWTIGWTLAYGIAGGENHAFANNHQTFGMGFTEADENGKFTTSTDMLNWFFQWAFCSAAATIVSGGVESFDPHNLPLVILGTFILWFGWYGFNSGSTLGLTTLKQGAMAAQVAMNTTISAATGGITVLMLRKLMYKKYDIGGMCNGILAGLVSITAPCGNVECGSAFLIGLIGAFVYQGASSLLQKLQIDDPIDAFAVHGSCGAWGTIAAALFDWGTGTNYFNGWSGWSCVGAPTCTDGAWSEAFTANVLEVVCIAGWTAGWSLLVFFPLRVTGFLRADDDAQDKGMDAQKHSPTKAYSMS